jgi:hypothetical protein
MQKHNTTVDVAFLAGKLFYLAIVLTAIGVLARYVMIVTS